MSPGHCVSYATRARLYFGDTWYESGTTTKFKFATYERDSESTNDYARARSYINRFGRFSSPDPVEPMEGQKAQALNRYPYVTNDPVNLTDPTGLKTTPGPFVVPFLQRPTDSSPGGGDCLVPSGFLGGLDIFFCLVGGPAGEAGGGGGGY